MATGTGGRAAGGATGTGGGATGSGGAIVTGTGGAADGGVAGSGGGVVAAINMGKMCVATADCGAGLICLLPTDKLIIGAAGPAHGYCTFPCTGTTGATAAADQAKCRAAAGVCVDFRLLDSDPPQAFCMQTCVFGTPGTATAPKCQQRPDVACTTFPSPTTGGAPQDICIPTCSQDSDCPAGRQCDDAFSVCVDAKTAGAPLGTHCDSMATTRTCAGDCLSIAAAAPSTATAASFCSRSCVFGSLNSCNWVDLPMSLATNQPHGVCVLTAGDVGDLGFCDQQCDAVADCTDKTDLAGTCDTTVPQLGHGFCSWP